MAKKAVILFNLGGPDSLDTVKPFLFNLFYDKAIITAPNPIRFLLAKLISTRRKKTAQEIYQFIGGKSPILEETNAQKEALEAVLNKSGEGGFKIFICMRHWHPMAEQVVKEVKDYDPNEIILLPLYPQFSTTTSGSSIDDWHKICAKNNLNKPTKTICCYPLEDKYINSHVNLIKQVVADKDNYRILFSAHGLPKKIVAKGDPYQWQVEQNAQKIVDKISIEDLDWQICYQSRVGPLEWIGPSTEDEIYRCGKDGKNIILVPIAFVSEHSETLVELDIEYKKLAHEAGVAEYIRVPTLSVDENYINSLADICLNSGQIGKICANDNTRICPKDFSGCRSVL